MSHAKYIFGCEIIFKAFSYIIKVTLKKSSLIVILIVFAIVLNACKSSKKNTLIKRAYHNTTAHYNGYFNAKLRVDNAERLQEKAYQDKFEDILSVYKIDKANAEGAKGGKSNNQALDEAIKKASIVIQRHEISKWIDDCYFEIGRAHFYKKDYFTAAETFQFIAGKYKNTEPANRSYIWLIKSFVILKKYQQAESVINIALASESFPKKYLPDLFAATAYFYIERKNYAKGIEYLEKNIPLEKKKSRIARHTFILAQLYEKVGQDSKAGLNYQKVVKLNPPYEMMFNARINAARLAQTQTLASRKNMEKELMKMLKDDKNIEFRDQIYYGLGLIYEKEKDEKKTIETFRKSANVNMGNLGQKGKTFLKLASIYYNKKNYEYAQMYYDSAYTFLPKTHEEYEIVTERKNSLLKLVTNLKVINREDSLMRLSKMPEKERIDFVEKLVKREAEEKKKREEEQKRLAEAALSNMAGANSDNNSSNNPTPPKPGAGTTWYFYNVQAKGIGANDFIRKYGKRTLEDNWRRSNKETITNILGNNEETKSAENSEITDPKKAINEEDKIKKKYLADIPSSQEAMNASIDRMVKAYYNIGQFYREDIIDLKESIKSYENALLRFPNNKLEPEIYFNLYRLYTQQKNQKQSDYYKNLLLSKYPNTILAKVVLDPSYTSEAKELDKNAQMFYDNIYNAYREANYQAVIAAKPRIDSVYALTSIAPRYEYLHAIAQSKLYGNEALEKYLNEVIKKFPSSDAANAARENLQKLNDLRNPEQAKTKAKAEEVYVYENKAKYQVMISTSIKSNLKQSIQNLVQFNSTQFALLNLKVGNELLGLEEQMILVNTFEDFAKAKEYVNLLAKSEAELIKFNKENYFISIISENNLKTLRKNKLLKEYIVFYTSNYK